MVLNATASIRILSLSLAVAAHCELGMPALADSIEAVEPARKSGLHIADWALNRHPGYCSTIAFDSGLPVSSNVAYMSMQGVYFRAVVRNLSTEDKYATLRLLLKAPDSDAYMRRGTIHLHVKAGETSERFMYVSPAPRVLGSITTGLWKGRIELVQHAGLMGQETFDTVTFDLFVQSADQPTLGGKMSLGPGTSVWYKPPVPSGLETGYWRAVTVANVAFVSLAGIYGYHGTHETLWKSTYYDFIQIRYELNRAAMRAAEINCRDLGTTSGRRRMVVRWRNKAVHLSGVSIMNCFDRALVGVVVPATITIESLPENACAAVSEDGRTRAVVISHIFVDKRLRPSADWHELSLVLDETAATEPYEVKAFVSLQYGPFQGELGTTYEKCADAPWIYNYELWLNSPDTVYWYTISLDSTAVLLKPEPSSAPETPGMLDVVFCIDVSGSMRDDIQAVQAATDTILAQLGAFAASANISLQVGLVTYTRTTDGESWIAGKPLTSDIAMMRSYIQGIQIVDPNLGGGGNEDTYAALLYAMNETVHNPTTGKDYSMRTGRAPHGMGWRGGAAKIAIPITDEPPNESGPGSLGEVATVAENLDPVHVYPLVVAKRGASFLDTTVRAMNRLADATGGQVVKVADARDLPDAMVRTIKLAVRRHREEVWRETHPPYWLYGAAIGVALLVLLALLLAVESQRRRRLRDAGEIAVARATVDPTLTGQASVKRTTNGRN